MAEKLTEVKAGDFTLTVTLCERKSYINRQYFYINTRGRLIIPANLSLVVCILKITVRTPVNQSKMRLYDRIFLDILGSTSII